MNYQRRMSSIVLLLLWTFCSCGTGTENGANVTTIPVNVSRVSTSYGIETRVENHKYEQELGNQTVSPNKAAPHVITTARPKLWSPYSTVANFMAESEDEVIAGRKVVQKETGTSTVGESRGESNSGTNGETGPVGADDIEFVQKIPIISSIRHFRSRKSFVRTRKNPSNNKLQSELMVKTSHVDVQDLESEQGDQPYYHPISATDPAATEYTSGTEPPKYGKVVASKANSEGPNSGISSESDMEAVYGIQYFTRAKPDDGNSSSKMQRINKTFLFQKRTKNNASMTNTTTSDSNMFPPTSHQPSPVSTSKIFGFTSPDLLLSRSSTANSGENVDNANNGDYYRDRENLATEHPSVKPQQRGKSGGGKKSRGKGSSTRRPKKQERTQSLNEKSNSESENKNPSSQKIPIGVERKQVGTDLQQHGAFRKVQEKQRMASRHPEIRGKSDYKPNYNSDAHGGDDNDQPSQLSRGSSSSQLQDQLQRQSTVSAFGSNINDKAAGEGNEKKLFKSSTDFGKVETDQDGLDKREPNVLDVEGSEYDSVVFRPSNPNSEEYENSDSSQSSSPNADNDYNKTSPKVDIVTVFLKIVESQHLLGENCSRGTEFNLGEGVVDRYAQERFRLEAELTVNRANMLTRFWKYADPKTLEDEYMLHAMVISLIEFDEDIFAAGNCYDENQYKNYTLFCPYGYRLNDGSILIKDLSLEYPYQQNTSEWFHNARKNAERIVKSNNRFSRGHHRFRKNEPIPVDDEMLNVTYYGDENNNFLLNESIKVRQEYGTADEVLNIVYEDGKVNQSLRVKESIMVDREVLNITIEDEILNVTYEDGKWSKPYFDCGGGNIWMMTYTVPFFGYNGTYYFKGTSGIDVDLRRVDIDQCPLPANSTELNIFAASDKCKNSTTKPLLRDQVVLVVQCVPIKGLGFRRGSYRCECKDGFYFPNVSSPLKYFNGTLLEEEYEKKFTGNETSLYDMEGLYECLMCPHGCDTCMDDRPCVVSLNWLMRSAILILQCAIIAMLPIVGLFTWKYSNVKVVRAASPVLLRFIVLGAFFIYCTILVMYPSPNVITCTLRVWLREIGFSLAYGALMLKTWRISVIFRVRSAKAIKITDMDLMKRLGIIVAVFTSLLVIRTLVAPPVAIVSLTADELKAWLCKSDWWDHSFTIMELSVLVWGIRLCISVRKAPSEFNESKFISLAIYNEFLLSLFLNISMLFLQSPANPDLLYIIFFCHVQLTLTVLLCLIFGSKAYIVFRGQGKGGSDETSRTPTSKFISKSRSGPTTKQASAHNSTGGLHSSTTSTTGPDPNLNSRLSEDVQEEFRRLYFQLEELKERNMRLGNRHLVAKIAAMQEAADNILCTSVQINGQHQIQYQGSSPNVKGKLGGVLSDISEEENLSQLQLNVQTLKAKGATGIASEEESCSIKHEYNSEDDRSGTTTGSRMPTKPSERDGQLGKHSDEEGERYLQKVNVTRKKSSGDPPPDEVQLRKLQDTNLDEVEVAEGQDEIVVVVGRAGVTFDLPEGENDIKQDCINDGDGENIPMKTLRKRKHKQPSSEGKSESGLNSSGKPGEKSQNHTGSNTTTGTASSKLVLDLDDKSRFTEEITV